MNYKTDYETLYTPVHTMYMHLANLQADNYSPAVAARTLNLPGSLTDSAQTLAIKLKKILDGRGMYIEFDNVPALHDYTDSITGRHIYYPDTHYKDIYLERTNGIWLYSENMVRNISAIYEQMYPVEFLGLMPDFAKVRVMGMQLWKYIGILIYIMLSLITYLLLYWIFSYLLTRVFANLKYDAIIKKYLLLISKPLSLTLVIVLLRAFMHLLQLPVQVNTFIYTVLGALIPVFVTVVAYRLSDMLADMLEKIAEKTKSTVDDNLVPLARKVIKIVVVVFGGIYVLNSFEISIAPLLAGVSIGGLAFALAAQDTVKNLFGSLTIFTDQPFEVGDWIVFDGTEGTVMEVGVRSTRVRTFYDSVISIPNGKLADMLIDNMGRRDYRRYSTHIHLTYDTPADKVERYVEGLIEIVNNHELTRKDYYQIHTHRFSQKSIDVLFYIFFEVPDWTTELEARHDVILEALRLAERLSIRLAYPLRDYSADNSNLFDKKD